MAYHPTAEIITRAGTALRKSQGDMADLLGCSRRSISRWTRHGTTFSLAQVKTLAAHLAPVDRALATRVATMHGHTLITLGIEAPPPPPPAPGPPPEPAPHLVDAVVCAAAEALDASPRTVRPVLLAAFRRARELELRVEHVERRLATDAEPAARAAKK